MKRNNPMPWDERQEMVRSLLKAVKGQPDGAGCHLSARALRGLLREIANLQDEVKTLRAQEGVA